MAESKKQWIAHRIKDPNDSGTSEGWEGFEPVNAQKLEAFLNHKGLRPGEFFVTDHEAIDLVYWGEVPNPDQTN